jgi:2-polyprenyl-3-methyl-5-hydroxy-6-metoxy-1,4-benzoquinol methylase
VKVGVLIVAYNAETTLEWVLDRIPVHIRRQLAEILIQDDFSTDNTHAIARKYSERNNAAFDNIPITVVRHDCNLGYGGNQKAGYRYAIDHGWDVVVLLHGDGQYAPEVMDKLFEPFHSDDVDAVLGSRMMVYGDARSGGMPLYKYVGNRILSRVQNRLTGAGLTEWHSGYRAYRVRALADLPLAANSDGFNFDTQIILQLLGASRRIVEVPIPTYYGDEICRVNGLKYAFDVVRDTMRHRLGRTGFGGGSVGGHPDEYAFKPSPGSSHAMALDLVEPTPPLRVLDVGCGPGWVAAELRRSGHHVVGIDAVTYPGVTDRVDRFIQADLDAGLPGHLEDEFDIVLATDIIEHVRSPERLLCELTQRLRRNGRFIASVPNFAHWYPRGRTALGLFDYDQRGILDRTHLRHFTRRSFRRLLHDAGLEITKLRYTGLPLDAVGLSGIAGRLIETADRAAVRAWPTMFAYQFVVETRLRADATGGDVVVHGDRSEP